MQLDEAKDLALNLMAKHGLIESGWSFRFDNAKRRFGCCFYRKRVISLSKELTEIREESNVRNTILHEIAHALVGYGHGHSSVWKKKAIEIGCNGQRCSNDATLKGKWVGVCPAGHVHYKHRRPQGKRSCALCCKQYSPKHEIIYREN